MKFQKVPEQDGYGFLSFDDVTELNLKELFRKKAPANDEKVEDSKAMCDLLKVLHRNRVKVSLHNYYKGISITNDANIVEIGEGKVVLETSYIQQKAIQYEQKSLIIAEALPHAIVCEKVENISFDKKSVEFSDMRFIKTSPITRSTLRIVPEEEYKVSLFIGGNKFLGVVKIEDISLDAVKLNLNALPAGLKEESDVILDIVFTVDKLPLIINTGATLFRKSENKDSFDIVFKFNMGTEARKNLVKYITKRQMAIIREFKGLQNG